MKLACSEKTICVMTSNSKQNTLPDHSWIKLLFMRIGRESRKIASTCNTQMVFRNGSYVYGDIGGCRTDGYIVLYCLTKRIIPEFPFSHLL